MHARIPLFPEQASTLAPSVDLLFFFLVAVSVFFGLLIATLLVVFAIRFRRRAGAPVPRPIHGSTALELFWTIIPFGIGMIIFFWVACSGVSSGSKLTVSTSNSLPTSKGSARIELSSPFSTSVQSIGQR